MKIPNHISLDKNGQYCLSCFNETVERFFENDKTYYKCSSCNEIRSRSLVIDDKITQWIDDEGIYWHESVGVIIQDDDGRIFCILRKIYPFAYALPAGHLDHGEDPKRAAKREVEEEIGVPLADLKLLGRFHIYKDKCRRGCDDHMWSLFTSRKPKEFDPILSDEASEWAWLSKEELLNIDDVVYPLKYIVENFGSEF